MTKHDNKCAIINAQMQFKMNDSETDLSDLFDENLMHEVLKEDELRNNIKSITDFHAVIDNGYCTEKELHDLKKHIDKALQNGMTKTGYLTDDDKIDASSVCDLIVADAYNENGIKMIKHACERKLKDMATKGDGHV